MPRDRSINVYHETDITHLDAGRVTKWCEHCLTGRWNVIADSGPRGLRGDGGHTVILLCEALNDAVLFRLSWL